MKLAFRFELAPNREPRVLLARSAGCSRFVYNWGLAQSRRSYELTGKRPRFDELKARLVDLKAEYPWLYEVSAHISQSALKDLNTAYDRFFKGLRHAGPSTGFPRFKRKGERDSARLIAMAQKEFADGATMRLDYFQIVDPDTLESQPVINRPVLVAVAGLAGKTRLIDNILLGP